MLGVEAGATYAAAHRAYRIRARSTHPDTAAADGRQPTVDEMARLNLAWAVVRAELAEQAAEHPSEPPGARRVPARGRTPRQMSAVAAAVIVAGLGLVTVLPGGDASPQDYLGACLTGSGDVVDCSGDDASVRVTDQVPSSQDCEGQVFASPSRDAFFCTVPLTS